MSCPKPVTLLNLFAGALFAVVLATTVTRSSVVEASAPPPSPHTVQAPQTAPPRHQAPATPLKGYVGTETCATCHTGYDTSINATKHGRAEGRGHARRRAGMRNVPRSRRGARQRSGEGQAEAVQQDCRQGGQCHLHDLPQQGRACVMERQPARSAQCLVHQLPQHPQADVDDGAAEGDQSAGHLHHLPSRQGGETRQVGPHAGARRQDGVHLVPQPARHDQREAAEDRQLGQRVVLVVSRREARARGCSNTPASTARVARRATIRTDPATTACWSRSCRSSVSGATTTPGIRRRSTTTRSCKAATACSVAAA